MLKKNLKSKAFIYIGGSYPQIQGIKAIKKADIFVILIDKNKYVPCSEFADIHLKIDATETDKIINGLKSYTKSLEILGFYGIGDYANKSITKLNKFFKINYNRNETLNNFSNKIICHKLWAKKNRLKPTLLWSGKKSNNQSFFKNIPKKYKKIIIKPAESFDSKGINICNVQDLVSINQAINTAFQISNEVLIEEFIEGELVNIDGVIIKNSVYFLSLIRRGEKNINQNLKYKYGIGFLNLSEKSQKHVKLLSSALMQDLGYENGPFTIDAILKDECFYPIDASPHLHAVKFYENCKSHPLTIWINYLKSNKKVDLGFYKRKIGYCAVITTNNNRFKNPINVKKIIDEKYIIDSYKNTNLDPRNSNLKSLNLIFWYKFLSDKFLSKILKKITEIF